MIRIKLLVACLFILVLTVFSVLAESEEKSVQSTCYELCSELSSEHKALFQKREYGRKLIECLSGYEYNDAKIIFGNALDSAVKTTVFNAFEAFFGYELSLSEIDGLLEKTASNYNHAKSYKKNDGSLGKCELMVNYIRYLSNYQTVLMDVNTPFSVEEKYTNPENSRICDIDDDSCPFVLAEPSSASIRNVLKKPYQSRPVLLKQITIQ